jgi:hypothetical protein
MAFNVDQAVQAGYSYDEIANHMAQGSGFDIDKARKSGYSSAEIVSHLGNLRPAGTGQAAPPRQPSIGGEVAPEDVEFAKESPNLYAAREALKETGRTLGKAITSVPGSAAEYGKALVQPVLHPLETAEAIGKTGAGLISKVFEPGVQPEEQYVDAISDFYKKRFGSLEGFKKTLEEDPVGLVADLSAVLTATGGAAGTLLKATGKPAKLAGAATKAGAAIEPLSLVTKPVGIAVQAVAKKLYENSVKFSTVLKKGKRSAQVAAALDEHILPTEGGLKRLEAKINNINLEIDAKIKSATKSKKRIKSDDVLNRLDDVSDKFQYALDVSDIKQDILDMKTRFKKEFGEYVSPKTAQGIKKQIYRELKGKYGELKGSVIETQKTLARGLKEELEVIHPILKSLNAKDGTLIELNHSLERAVGRIRNRNIISLIGGSGAGVVGAVAGGGEGALMTLLAYEVVTNPTVKSALAIALNKGRKLAAQVSKTGPRQLAFQAGRTEEVVNE